MKPEAQEIALAILARVEEQGGFVNKTKLLKLLYLADIEHYRKFGETLTGFDWIFYLFGPWTAEYDAMLAELERRDAITLRTWANPDRDGARIDLRDPRDLDGIIRDTDEFYRIRHQIDAWSDRSVSDLLDYVYFETEPMFGAISGRSLDFNKVAKDPPRLYRRASSQTHPQKLNRMRAKLKAIQTQAEKRQQATLRSFRPPVFDDVYESALAELEEKENFGT